MVRVSRCMTLFYIYRLAQTRLSDLVVVVTPSRRHLQRPILSNRSCLTSELSPTGRPLRRVHAGVRETPGTLDLIAFPRLRGGGPVCGSMGCGALTVGSGRGRPSLASDAHGV